MGNVNYEINSNKSLERYARKLAPLRLSVKFAENSEKRHEFDLLEASKASQSQQKTTKGKWRETARISVINKHNLSSNKSVDPIFYPVRLLGLFHPLVWHKKRVTGIVRNASEKKQNF